MSSELQQEATEHPRPHAEGDEHGKHPSEGQYVIIAVILGTLTLVEVLLSYHKVGGSQDVTNSALLVLAAIKFSMVAMFFMHLRFDNKLLRRLFLMGLTLAIVIYLAYLSTLHAFG